MNFFSVDSSPTGGHLKSSKDLWIYFVIAVPLTTIVLCVWWWWQRKGETEAKMKHTGRAGVDKDVEMQVLGDRLSE